LNVRRNYPKKSLGQNYLVDENICRNIVSSFEISDNDHVVEIGAGQGAITGFLLEKTKNLTAIEIDRNNCSILKERFPALNILNADFLKYRFEDENNRIRVIGNIPYNITTEIVFRLIDFRKNISDVQLMIQEEVARRFAAPPGSKEYGIPSVLLQVFSRPELKFKVSKNCFYPRPKVDSRIIYFDFSESKEKEIKDIEYFRRFVKASFGQRRKTLRNALKVLELDLTKIEFDFSRRAETLSIDEFIELSNIFC
jgi:16S rRNA (adenine1518-N6/adenine1519-N6)-dimethyltransferase